MQGVSGGLIPYVCKSYHLRSHQVDIHDAVVPGSVRSVALTAFHLNLALRPKCRADEVHGKLCELEVRSKGCEAFAQRVADDPQAATFIASRVILIRARLTSVGDVEVEDAVGVCGPDDFGVQREVVDFCVGVGAFDGEAMSSAKSKVCREQVEGCRSNAAVAEVQHHDGARVRRLRCYRKASVADERVVVLVLEGLEVFGLVGFRSSKRCFRYRAFPITFAWGASAYRRLRKSTSFQRTQEHLHVGMGAGKDVAVEVARGQRGSEGWRGVDSVRNELRERVKDCLVIEKRAGHRSEGADEVHVVGSLSMGCRNRGEGLPGIDDVGDEVVGGDALSVEDVLGDVRLSLLVPFGVPTCVIIDVGDVLGEIAVRGEVGVEGRIVHQIFGHVSKVLAVDEPNSVHRVADDAWINRVI